MAETVLINALKKNFGFDTFKGNQQDIIQSLIDGHDTFVLMPTGGGKSLCYQLPALLMAGTAIIISPLIALMKNQVDMMRHYSENDSIAHFLNSSLSRQAIDQVKIDLLSGRTKLLYMAPESLNKDENVEFLRSVPISFYAIDEAHCISEWGHDFRPEYRRIRPIINQIQRRPVIALTATATPKVQHDIQKNLGMQDAHVFKSSFNRENLYYEIRPKSDKTIDEIVRFIRLNAGKSGIIYCLSRRKVEEIAEELVVNKIRALPYHAGMDAQTRSANQDAFLLEKVEVIVATIAFGMGIDKPDVRFVIHYDMPKTIEGYYQETGRAGRDGGEGKCITFYSPKDLVKMEKFMQGKPVNEMEIGRQLLRETMNYAESAVCRRSLLLSYFGEEYHQENCGHCDNCVNPKNKIEGRDVLCYALETIIAVKQRFKIEQIIDIMMGVASSEIRAYKCQELETFGICANQNCKFIHAVIRQGILKGMIEREIENYGVLKVTADGIDFLENPTSFMVVEDREYDAFDDGVNYGGVSALDETLFKMLCNLRRQISSKYSVPPYVVFFDASLDAMATMYPVTIEELQNIPGVGLAKAKRYGKAFVDLISKYVEENEIERPNDIRVRTLPKRSNLRIQIVQAIDRKIALDELARSKGMELAQLLDEIKAIVYAGNKINMKYHIYQIFDENFVEDVYDFFREYEDDDIEKAYDEALDEFSEDLTEDELRMLHLQFINDFGN